MPKCTRSIQHVMEFKKHADLTTAHPTHLVAHQLTCSDLTRYDKETGEFRGQNIRFKYCGVAPKVGEFLVRFDDEFQPVPVGEVVLVGAARFYTIIGDDKSLDNLGKLGSATCA